MKLPTKKGLYDNIPNDIYHGDKSKVSSSTLKRVLISPAHVHLPSKETKAMKFGTLVHTLVLEPEKFEDEYAVEPDLDKRTTKGKADHEAFKATAKDKIVISETEYRTAKTITQKVSEHKFASFLLEHGKSEQTAIWYDYKEKEWLKVRPDHLPTTIGGTIVDFKTSSDASPESFAKDIYNYKYHLSAAMYIDGMINVKSEQFTQFIFIVAETVAPYNVSVFKLDEEALKLGYQEYRKALGIYHSCKMKNKWYGYLPDDEVRQINLPQFALRRGVVNA